MIFLCALTAVSSITILLHEPGPLILLSAVIGFVGTVLFSLGLVALNFFYLPRFVPPPARPRRAACLLICGSCIAYAALAVAYFLLNFQIF